jgi:ABC-type molybdate transport system permease subunit
MKYPRLTFAFISLLIILLLNIVLAFAITMINGPHPECGVNSEVGPCNVVGASLNTAGWNIVPALLFWLLAIFVSFIFIWKKRGSNHKKRDIIILALVLLPVLMTFISFIAFQKNY